jgi:hypothetical protein
VASAENAPIRSGSRWKQTLLGLLLLAVALLAGLWVAVHRLPWMGPLVADSLRAVVGKEAVTRLEEWAYGAEDRWNRIARRGEAPKAYWQTAPGPSSVPATAATAQTPRVPPFHPDNVGPVHKSWSAPGDGDWVPIPNPRRPTAAPALYKTLLHPDRNRSWAELFVVAIDLRQVRLRMVLGYQEPASTTREGLEKLRHRTPARPAVVPAEDHGALLAAFNGSFKTEHGAYGAMLDGVTVVAPRKPSCAIALLRDGAVRVASWERMEPELSEMVWYRQAPSCMLEDGKLHPGLLNPNTMSWGATLDGDTVIRRSAAGIDPSGMVLYVGITNSTTARALADGMHHAGATTVAQLDVNWSYPKFVLFEPRPEDGGLEPKPLASGFELSPGEYLKKRSMRDFFYLVEKPGDERKVVR